MSLPITVIVTTKNEAVRIGSCLDALHDFAKVIVVDSESSDGTSDLARDCGAQLVHYVWDGQYPKKRQWCLDHLAEHCVSDWVFFVDADEVITPDLIAELRDIDWSAREVAGYFVRGRYVLDGKPLRFGMMNNKLALLNRRAMMYPVVDDLDIPGMGEIEGHYQPVRRKEFTHFSIGQIKAPLLHDACDDIEAWQARHQRYRLWENGMDERCAWPADISAPRRMMKAVFRRSPSWLRACFAFMHSYIWKLGILDGVRGYRFAALRAAYYMML